MNKLSKGILVVLVALIVVAGGALAFFWAHLEGFSPEVQWDKKFSYLGKSQILGIKISDKGKGLKSLKLTLSQPGQSKVLLEKVYEPASTWPVEGVTDDKISAEIQPQKMGFKDGPAELLLEVRDRSWREWFHGNVTLMRLPLVIDTSPPPLVLLGRSVYINRGGAAVAIYQTEPEVAHHGVQMGERFFPGYAPWPDKPNMRLCLFVFGQGQPRDTQPVLLSRDLAGNQTSQNLPIRIRWKEFRTDRLNISDRFLGAVLPRFAAEIPSGLDPPIEAYNWVNSKLRVANNQQISQAAAKAESGVHFSQAFIRQPGKRMAGYADRRTYFYKNKPVGKAVHLGVDVADVLNAPILAAAGGKVSHAGPLGIYGNTVILLHGLGVATLYAHLSDMGVSVGQTVAKGDRLGSSGATGLALGDHLHFSVLVGGVYTDPVEWWDPHWINDSFISRVSLAGLPWPGGGAAQARTETRPEGESRP